MEEYLFLQNTSYVRFLSFMYRMSLLEGKEFLCVLNQENVKKAGKAPEALSRFPLKTNYCQRETKRKANLGQCNCMASEKFVTKD